MTPQSSVPSPPTPAASMDAKRGEDGALLLILSGNLTALSIDAVWRRALGLLASPAEPVRSLGVDVAGVAMADGAGVALLIDLKRAAIERAIPFNLTGLSEKLRSLIDLYDPQELLKPPVHHEPDPSAIEEIGRSTEYFLRDFRFQVAFIGELFAAIWAIVLQPRRLRRGELMVTIERAGVDALPIVLLLGFLIGLIMAFQAAIPLRRFGAELYVADFTALVMVRELGALITALILIGRTASAFAAELGTMKINEELNALETLGLDPVRFLVVGRVIACIIVTPLLALFAMLAGLIGGLVVSLSLGFPVITYYKEAVAILNLQQFFAGLVKTLVFGLQVGAIGCMRGLQTRSGASAVGLSATRAVVTAIVVLVVTDGLFAVIYYYLNI